MIDRRVVEARLRETAGGLLRAGRVDLFLGYTKPGLPFGTRPLLLADPEHVDALAWNSFCNTNLAAYLPELLDDLASRTAPRPPCVGMMAKPCDARAALMLVREGRLPRDSLLLVGARCHGILDRARAEAALEGKEALGAAEDKNGDVRAVIDDGSELTLLRSVLLHPACRECRQREPEACDLVLDRDDAPPPPRHAWAPRPADPDGIRGRLAAELERCVRCDACTAVCPVHAGTIPAASAGDDETVPATFHLARFRRVDGRCVACGSCARACPMGVDALLLVRATERVDDGPARRPLLALLDLPAGTEAAPR